MNYPLRLCELTELAIVFYGVFRKSYVPFMTSIIYLKMFVSKLNNINLHGNSLFVERYLELIYVYNTCSCRHAL